MSSASSEIKLTDMAGFKKTKSRQKADIKANQIEHLKHAEGQQAKDSE